MKTKMKISSNFVEFSEYMNLREMNVFIEKYFFEIKFSIIISKKQLQTDLELRKKGVTNNSNIN
jgi:hypothetical protein